MAEHLRRRGGIWYGTVYLDGRRVERTTGCTQKKAARAVLSDWEQRAADPNRAAEDHTLEGALNLVLEDRAARVRNGDGSAVTVAFYKKAAGHVVRLLGYELPLSRIRDASTIWPYIDERRSEGAADTTIDKEVVIIRASLKLAMQRGWWRGDLDAVIPDDFDPQYVAKERNFKRAEFELLIPRLGPDAAAAAAFIVATGAEDAALHRALRADLDRIDDRAARVPVRGSKTPKRNRMVPVVTDEQWTLLDFARRHAQGEDGMLFGKLANLRRDLAAAAVDAGIPHVWPHALRKAAGQWLIDLGVPLEVVSRVLGHADTRITELVYCRVSDDALFDRMLDAIDSRYAQRATAARGNRVQIPTITNVPEPKPGPVKHVVDGVGRVLDDWAKVSGISKTTLHHRVVKRGMTMADALALGRGTKGKALPSARGPSVDCRTGAATEADGVDFVDADEDDPEPHHPELLAGVVVPRDGIEPPTRGFSIPCSTN